MKTTRLLTVVLVTCSVGCGVLFSAEAAPVAQARTGSMAGGVFGLRIMRGNK